MSAPGKLRAYIAFGEGGPLIISWGTGRGSDDCVREGVGGRSSVANTDADGRVARRIPRAGSGLKGDSCGQRDKQRLMTTNMEKIIDCMIDRFAHYTIRDIRSTSATSPEGAISTNSLR